VIDYLIEENRALREQLRGWRVRLSDDQRHRPATKGTPEGLSLSWTSGPTRSRPCADLSPADMAD